jgi:hypothetical protein
VSPSVTLRDILLGGQGLHHLDDGEVGDSLDFWVLGEVEVLLGEKDALCNWVGKDGSKGGEKIVRYFYRGKEGDDWNWRRD